MSCLNPATFIIALPPYDTLLSARLPELTSFDAADAAPDIPLVIVPAKCINDPTPPCINEYDMNGIELVQNAAIASILP